MSIAAPAREQTAGFIAPTEYSARIPDLLRRRIGPIRFEQWFDGKTRWIAEGHHLRVVVGNAFAANWIRNKFFQDIRAVAQAVLGGEPELLIELAVPPTAGDSRSDSAPPAPPRPDCAPAGRPVGQAGGASLNPRYRLEEFVAGPTNQLAYHAARRVADDPRREFNPLFIHGQCGLGKTHLLQGVCHYLRQAHPEKRWLYLTGEQFTNEFLEAIKANRMESFRRRLRQADLLAIDDVHFFASKRRTQEEFLHTFDQIDANNRQVILACDSSPRDIAALSEALRSRFVSGMVIRIDPPDLPTRLEILRRFLNHRQWRVSDLVLMQLAQAPVASVRELEGLAVQMVARSELGERATGNASGKSSSTLLIRELHDRLRPPAPVAIDRIVKTAADFFAIPPGALMGASRRRLTATARAVAMYLARQHSHMSFPDIGRAIGGRNHSTVIGACRRIEAQIAAGAVIYWNTPDGPRHRAMAEILQHIAAQLRRPP